MCGEERVWGDVVGVVFRVVDLVRRWEREGCGVDFVVDFVVVLVDLSPDFGPLELIRLDCCD